MKSMSMFTAALLLVALGASAQDRGTPGQSPSTSPSSEPASSQYQAPPGSSQPSMATEASSSKTLTGTVESFTEGKTLKIKTAEGKTKTFNLKDAAIDPGVKVGSAVKVTQSRDVNGKSSLTVEPDQGKQ
jgi:ABC-type oligopeptide transport system substrate-binding subunit